MKWMNPLLAVALGCAGMFPAGGREARAEAESKAVGICCAWGSSLSDGVLNYSLTGDDQTALSIIRQAIDEWDQAFADLSLREVSPRAARRRSSRADITIVYGPGAADGGENHTSGTQGLTTTYMNSRRMVTRVEIGIEGGPPPVDAGAVEQIAKHEIGHALGLGHANFEKDLMSPLVEPTPAPVPPCDLNAVKQANSWWMVDRSKRPRPSRTSETRC